MDSRTCHWVSQYGTSGTGVSRCSVRVMGRAFCSDLPVLGECRSAVVASPVRAEHLSPNPCFAPANPAFEPLPLLRIRHHEQFVAERTDLTGDALIDDRSRIDDLGHNTIIAPTRTPIGCEIRWSTQRLVECGLVSVFFARVLDSVGNGAK